MITQSRLKELLNYNPETGVFTWIVKKRGTTKSKLAGGNPCKTLGYCRIQIDGLTYRAHRLAWLYVHGVWPEQYIDHINSVKHDNRLANLRPATPSENDANRKLHKSNSLQCKNVTFEKSRNQYRVCVQANGVQHTVRFNTLEDAVDASQLMREVLHGQFANHGTAITL